MKTNKQQGQTLIETIVAIFLLATALTAAVGVSIYALSTSANNFNQLVATNLAREGIEVVRMMRDSNWLAGDAAGGLYDLQACDDIGDRFCYPQAYGGPTYYIGAQEHNILVYDREENSWSMEAGNSNYELYLQEDGSYTNTPNGTSVFSRLITVTRNNSAPYTAENPELVVKSIVAWRGRGCVEFSASQDLEDLSGRCKIVLEERLTNWKDYK